MNYLVAVLTNRSQLEAVYRKLVQAKVPKQQISLLGKGYQSADEFGLIQPNRQAGKQAKRLISWLIPFGFVAGYTFNVLTGIIIFPGLGNVGNHILGGLLGAASGALGAVFTGGAVGWTVGSGDALAYRNRLNAGKYLLIFKGTDTQLREVTKILRLFEPENIQGYQEPLPT